jgi:beta-mannanase
VGLGIGNTHRTALATFRRIAIVAVFGAIAAAPGVAQADEPPLVLGANTENIDQTGVASSLDSFQQRTGVMPKIVMYFRDWNPNWSTALIDPKVTQPILDRGAVPMITWEPINAADSAHPYTPAQVASGAYDTFIRRAADEAVAYNKPFFIRLAHEMNGVWSPWGPGVSGNTPADYIAMWQHIVSIFRAEGATNAKWVWSPNVFGGSTGVGTFEPYYPGDAWVDEVGLDGYNFGTEVTGQSWHSFFEVFSHSYDTLASITGKPVIIAETSSTEVGGDKAAWINGIASQISSFPRIRALIWFDRNKESDWRVDSSVAAGAAFRSLASSALFSGTVAGLLAAPTVAPSPKPPEADPDPTEPTGPDPWSDQVAPQLTIDRTPAPEGDHGTHERSVFKLSLSEPTKQRVSLGYHVGAAGNAKKGFSRGSGRVVIRAGHRSAAIRIRVRGDRRPERNERLVVRLFDPKNATLEQHSAAGSIVDDD